MVDYVKPIGTQAGSRMMIRDTGTYVEFWIISGSPYTYAYAFPWGYTINGSTTWTTGRYESGGKWYRCGRWNIASSQTVTFRLGDTGTVGLNGPTTFSKFIDRVGKPDPPSKPVISNIKTTSAYVTFTDGDNNGDAIDKRQIMYGTSTTPYDDWVYSDRSTTITGLKPGTRYYVWARTHNEKGWSNYSPRATFVTLGGVRVRVNGVYRPAVPYVKYAGVWREATPYVNSSGVWKETG